MGDTHEGKKGKGKKGKEETKREEETDIRQLLLL
jgi:hypothetical protein